MFKGRLDRTACPVGCGWIERPPCLTRHQVFLLGDWMGGGSFHQKKDRPEEQEV